MDHPPDSEDVSDRAPLLPDANDERNTRSYLNGLPWTQVAVMFTAYFAETICTVFAVR